MKYTRSFNNIHIVPKTARQGCYPNGESGVLYNVLPKVTELATGKTEF